jgi:hypothetical protein
MAAGTSAHRVLQGFKVIRSRQQASATADDSPARLRSAFLLHYYAGFAIREVAVMLGRPAWLAWRSPSREAPADAAGRWPRPPLA